MGQMDKKVLHDWPIGVPSTIKVFIKVLLFYNVFLTAWEATQTGYHDTQHDDT
jgi:hypothetical protein